MVFLPLLRTIGRLGYNLGGKVLKKSLGDVARILANSHGKKL